MTQKIKLSRRSIRRLARFADKYMPLQIASSELHSNMQNFKPNEVIYVEKRHTEKNNPWWAIW